MNIYLIWVYIRLYTCIHALGLLAVTRDLFRGKLHTQITRIYKTINTAMARTPGPTEISTQASGVTAKNTATACTIAQMEAGEIYNNM